MRRKISPKFHVKNGVKNGKSHAKFTLLGRSADEYDRAKVPPHNGNHPSPAPGSLKTLLFPPLLNKVQKQGGATGTRGYKDEVRRGNSSIHFHCPVPWLSSHIGHGALLTRGQKVLGTC